MSECLKQALLLDIGTRAGILYKHITNRAGRYQKKDDDTIFLLNFTILLNITIMQFVCKKKCKYEVESIPQVKAVIICLVINTN